MTTTSIVTKDEITTLVESFKETYGKMWSESHTTFITKYLTKIADSAVDGEQFASLTRNHLWDNFTGGGVSANATRKAFAKIGHEDWCNPRWC